MQINSRCLKLGRCCHPRIPVCRTPLGYLISCKCITQNRMLQQYFLSYRSSLFLLSVVFSFLSYFIHLQTTRTFLLPVRSYPPLRRRFLLNTFRDQLCFVVYPTVFAPWPGFWVPVVTFLSLLSVCCPFLLHVALRLAYYFTCRVIFRTFLLFPLLFTALLLLTFSRPVGPRCLLSYLGLLCSNILSDAWSRCLRPLRLQDEIFTACR